MAQSIKRAVQKEYNHLKKVMKKLLTPGKERDLPPLALQPIRRQPGFRKDNNAGAYSR